MKSVIRVAMTAFFLLAVFYPLPASAKCGRKDPKGIHTGPALPAPESACGTDCGTERWRIKTLSDASAASVNFTPKKKTVSWLIKRKPPAYLPETKRISKIETQTFQVSGLLEGYKKEDDGDFHLVLADPKDDSKTLIAEIPDKGCSGACTSAEAANFEAARNEFAQHVGNATSKFKEPAAPIPVVITGVGFFDFEHHQRGVAPNCVELHPVLKIEFPQ